MKTFWANLLQKNLIGSDLKKKFRSKYTPIYGKLDHFILPGNTGYIYETI